jgi:hypothetical protein
MATAESLSSQIQLVAELDALDDGQRKAEAAQRSLDWADTTVRETLAPRATLDRHTASSDWLANTDTSGGDDGHHHAVIAEASVWFQRLDADVKADAHEFAEQAKGIARRTAGKYGERAEAAHDAFLQYVGFLNRQVLAASGLPQVEQLVDAQENPAETPLPTDVFDNFAPPVHPINQGVDGQQTNSLAPGTQEALSEGGGSPSGYPSQHEEGQGPVSQPYNMPASARQGQRKQAGVLERARHQAAQRGHSMQWNAAQGPDAWSGRCTGCGSAMAVTASGIVEGSTAHVQACNHRTTAGLSEPSVAMGYQHNMNDFLRAEAEANQGRPGHVDHSGWAETPNARSEPEAGAQNAGPDEEYNEYLRSKRQAKAGGAAPFVREADRSGGDDDDSMPGGDLNLPNADRDDEGEDNEPNPSRAREGARREAASGLDQVQQVSDSQENPKPTSLPLDTMFPIVQPWGEEQTQGGQDTGPTNRPRQASRKTADTWQGGDAPAAVPGGQTPVANSPATTPPRANSGDYDQGMRQGQQDAAKGDAPTFADASSGVSDFVRGYTQGYGAGQQPSGPQDVPSAMGGDNGQAQNAAEIAQRIEKPLTMASLTVSASLVSKDVSSDAEFQRGYRYARSWKPGQDIVAVGSSGEEAGIYAGITDNPTAQKAWTTRHKAMAREHPELDTRLREHHLVTSNLQRRDEDVVVKGLYVQGATSLDMDTMSPVTTPDPQGATPSEGPGTIPPLRGAPGSPAAPGGPAPYNGVEPLGQPVVPDPGIQQPERGGIPTPVESPDAVHFQGDSSLLSKSPSTMAFRQRVQAAKLALRQTKEN